MYTFIVNVYYTHIQSLNVKNKIVTKLVCQ